VRLGQSPIVGYIVAGLAIGPFTPGVVGDAQIVDALAELGVVFLLFAIGAQISIRDLLRVGAVAAIGGGAQVLLTIGLGFGVGTLLGWTPLEALFLGAVLSNSSSTVIAKVLGERGEMDTEHGRLAIAWSTVQDLSTIILIVILTAVSTTGNVDEELFVAMGRALVFLAVLVPAGLWVFPRVFEALAATRSREIFLLGVVGVALGTALGASLFGISLALGAFLAGLLVGESDLSHQVVGEALPFRDLFAGLFFVSVGMLVDPGFVVQNLPLALLMVGLIVVVKGVLVSVITALFGFGLRTTALTGLALAQSAEFSFLMARVGEDLGAIGSTVFSVMLVGAAGSIVLASPLHGAVTPLVRRLERRRPADAGFAAGDPGEREARRRLAVICGFGRVGHLIGTALERRGFAYIVIEEDARIVRELRARGVAVIRGTAANRNVLDQARLDVAAVLAVAVPDPVAVRTIVEYGRRANPRLPIVARAHSATEREALRRLGATLVVVGETELSIQMTRYTLRRLGISASETEAIAQGLRH